jgi:queuosine precursor transporter
MPSSKTLIALTGTFILVMSLADIAATKFITVAGVVAPGGIFLFSIIFVVRDMLHKLAGAQYARDTIKIAAGLNLLVAGYLYVIARFNAPGFFELAEPWNQIFALAPGIVLGSIVAAVVSQYVNTAVYQWGWERERPQYQRVIVSNAVSLPIDSVLFVVLAFVLLPPVFGATAIDGSEIIGRIVGGQIVIKAVIMLAMTPLIYVIPENPDAKYQT